MLCNAASPANILFFAIQIYKLANTSEQPVGCVNGVYGTRLVLQYQYQIKLKPFFTSAVQDSIFA